MASLGSRPQESKGSIVRVAIHEILNPVTWGMKIKQISGKTLHLTVMPSAKALIGQYEVFVETKMADDKKSVFRYKDDDKVCVLFNAWCKGKYNSHTEYKVKYKSTEIFVYFFVFLFLFLFLSLLLSLSLSFCSLFRFLFASILSLFLSLMSTCLFIFSVSKIGSLLPLL